MGAKVRDFTGGNTAPAIVQVGLHSAADLLVALWILDGCKDGAPGSPETYDIGQEWFDDLVAHFSDNTKSLLARAGSGEVWIGIMSLLPEEGDNGSVDNFIEFLSHYDPVELRFRLLMLHGAIPDDAREIAADAAEGNAEAIDAALDLLSDNAKGGHWPATLRFLLELEPVDTQNLLVDALTGVQEDIFSKFEAEFRPALERDVKARRTMARRMSPERLVEITTNGISIEGSGYQRPIMLIPSIVGRPWVVFTESRDNMIMSYPVADEYLDADPDAPPQWLIKTYKALGDERRLRLLRHLSRGPASLADLVEEMGVSKSTLHHHVMLLRTAGLLRITLGTDKEYSLRADVVPETAAVLQAYIGGSAREET